MYKQLDLFKKSQPTDLQALEDTVFPQHYSQTDWDLQSAWESGDTQRYQELLTIKHDMN